MSLLAVRAKPHETDVFFSGSECDSDPGPDNTNVSVDSEYPGGTVQWPGLAQPPDVVNYYHSWRCATT